MLFLIMRMTVTFISASLVYEYARKPLEIFRSIPSEAWSEELNRFFIQIKADQNGLSGNRFFFITRNVLLKLAGVLIIYELVLLQHDNNPEAGHTVSCS
jgi:gustatory receptor